ncbi:ABC transporter permease [Streptomyces sp. WAC 00631]|uniref:ABC transporter permease n=1 Tax=unclassified Streptomyces TaxID=2593676 RepID=UPI000F778F96|nr:MULTISPECIES: ABC transporter permease [unclassified Streptomyces]MCC5032566.1 ABC transporter permease [Streptomyces sp. WAC 00631]MCC9740662.1 ABC transporter permease [Streptomyces sp. MNU89]
MTGATATAAPRTPSPPPPATARSAALAGTGVLLRFGLRRDRIRIPVWLLSLTLGTMLTANSLSSLYTTEAERASTAETMGSPAALATSGPRHYLTDYTFGSMMGHQMLGFTAVLVGIMSVLIVSRHTRAEEETGRAELVRSTVVGRHAQLAAALGVAVVANVALALLLAAGLAVMGIESIGWGGSLLYGFAHAAAGIVFAAVAAVTVQITAHARGASGMALAVIGLAYALRATGDVGTEALAWLSPIGWVQRTYVYVDDRWWPVLLALAFAALVAAVAFPLSTRRDVGAGLRPTRLGRPAASDLLTRPVGFALRLHRGMLIGFGAGVFALGVMYGSILGDAEDMLKDLEEIQEAIEALGGATITESFASIIALILAIVASIYVVMAALRPRAEESGGRAEPLLATGLSRTRWVLSHVTVAAVGGVLLLAVAGFGFGIAGAAATGDNDLVGKLTWASIAYAPALWFTIGFAVALFGWVPRYGTLAWLIPVYSFVVGYLGQMLQFADWLNNLSPFGHVPQLPAADLEWAPLLVLTALAAGLVWLGLLGFRRRDLETK